MKKVSTVLAILAAHALAGLFAVASMTGLTTTPEQDDKCCYPPPDCAPWQECWDDYC